MIKLNFNYQPSTLSQISSLDLELARRLVVVVHDPEADLTSVTRRVWELAHATGAKVRFLGLCNDEAQEMVLRRTLVTASALMNSGNVSANSEIVVGKDWVSAVRSCLQQSDMLVCCQESGSSSHQKALIPILRADLGVPLYLLSKTQPRTASRSEWLPAAAAWIGSLAIIIAFFWLQVKIDQLAGGLSIPMQLLSIAVEFTLIRAWNKQSK